MPEQDSEPGFTVVDRRRRGEDEPTASRTARTQPDPLRPPSPRPESAPRAQGPAQADLTSFCVMLYSEALVHLGQVPDPSTGQPHVDLDQARFTIDLLGVLKEKTAGNRTPEESAVLEEILAALQMGFVRARGLQ